MNDKITKVKDIKNKLQSVEDCCGWKDNLINKCDDLINKYYNEKY